MCNIAGYVGEREAAPILIEMIRRQEGLNGGFFTGISTHDGEKIDYRKVEGDLDTLLSHTDATRLSGRTGMIHSRTPSGGNWLWSHPFVTVCEGRVKMSYVANGGIGAFKERNASYNVVADRLIAEGIDIPCKIAFEGDKYNRLSTGEAVHMSDVMCQLIYEKKKMGRNTVDAMTEAFCEMPSEIVGLVIEEECSDRIYFSRINQPMFVGFGKDGAYLASTPMAFPEEISEYSLLPALSSGVVYKDRYEAVSYDGFSMEVAAFDDHTLEQAEREVLALLPEGEAGMKDVFAAVKKILPEGKITQSAAIGYCAMTKLLRSGKIKPRASQRTVRESTAPYTLFGLTH